MYDVSDAMVVPMARDLPGQARVKSSKGAEYFIYSQIEGQLECVILALGFLHRGGRFKLKDHSLVSYGPGISGKATARISKPLAAEKLYLNKDIHFATFSDILEPQIKRFLPPNAVNITLYRQRNGHFAHYKISEEDFINLLNVLWEKDKWEKGKAVSKKTMAKQFQKLGWDSLENGISYSSPIQPNGAMTTYYFDAKADIAHENTGYWQ